MEAAIIAPLVLLLIYGVMETGYAFFGRLTVNNMSVVGARSGSGEANDVLADFAILQAVENGATGMGTNDITMVVVYRATSPDDRVPAACKTASVTNTSGTRGCNRYVSGDLALDSDQFGCIGPPGPGTKVDNFWCPTTRKTALQGANGPPDYIGVYVEAEHQNLTGIIGESFTFTTDTVIRIEPRTLT
ncbi:MAG: TadE family protein [Acidimicrobiia bacterium]